MADTYVVGETGKAVILKDPDATLDYIFDWTAWLDDIGDTLASAVVTPAAVDGTNLTLEDTNVVGKTVVAIISGGTAGKTYPVTCHIVTAAATPREDDRTIYIKVKER